ncbi:hypothetical protein JHK87_016094 [Glycine soja]|nr:hypothetical protein JHK87_016094 [Glycine soja]
MLEPFRDEVVLRLICDMQGDSLVLQDKFKEAFDKALNGMEGVGTLHVNYYELRLRAMRKGEGEGAASEEGTEETHREKMSEVSAQWSGESEGF